MTDEAAPSADAGQAGAGSEATQTPDVAPVASDKGQAADGKGTPGTSEAAPRTGDTETTFFDPKTVPKELEPAYKQMQAAFTKKMQGLSSLRQKGEFYDQFSADPVGNMQKLAAQYGYSLTRAQAEKMAGQGDTGQDWQPQTWQEVLQKAEERATQKVFNELRPLLQEVQGIKKESIEKQLAEIDPTWQQYEEDMIANLRDNPGLARDPAKLYRISVPLEVIEARATQKALAKFETKAKSTVGAGGSNTHKKPGGLDPEQRFSSVAEAAAWARRKMEDEGRFPPKK